MKLLLVLLPSVLVWVPSGDKNFCFVNFCFVTNSYSNIGRATFAKRRIPKITNIPARSLFIFRAVLQFLYFLASAVSVPADLEAREKALPSFSQTPAA